MPTCLAFAMALAQKKAKLDNCPDVSEEAKSALSEAAAPPIRLVKFGVGDAEVQIGQETVLYRHEEKFYNPTVVAVAVSDNLAAAELQKRLDEINDLKFERVGTHVQVNAVAVVNDGGDPDKFARTASAVIDKCPLAVILVSKAPAALEAALGKVAAAKPLLAAATAETADAVVALAVANNCPVVAEAGSVEALAELAEKIKATGVEDIVLSPADMSVKEQLYSLTKIRTLALKKNFRTLGHPTISYAFDGDDDEQSLIGSSLICKFSSIVVANTVQKHAILTMLTTIMNIFTDPQKPVQVEAKCYPVGEVTKDSPLLFTTNFSLTYYSVESDVEASRVPCHILVIDTEGTSVLTAYSGDKLNDQVVARAMADAGVEDMVSHRKLIIPGYVAVMSGKLEETTGWEVMVGPRESTMLPKYLQEIV